MHRSIGIGDMQIVLARIPARIEQGVAGAREVVEIVLVAIRKKCGVGHVLVAHAERACVSSNY